ncbi:hypothetical protein D9M69_228250 [compost metagenome]
MDLPVWLNSVLSSASACAQRDSQSTAQSRSALRPWRMYWVISLAVPRSISVISAICLRNFFSAAAFSFAREESEPSYLLVKTSLPVYGRGAVGHLPEPAFCSGTAAK